jgi:integrase
LVVEVTAADEARLIERLPQGYREIVAFAEAAGLRMAECLLRWSQVDERAGTITVVQKGGRPHTIPISARIADILSTCRGQHPEWVFSYPARRTRKPDRVRGRRYPITEAGLKSEWRRAAKALGLDYRFHDLRHTRATRLLRSSGNLKLVQRLLGHASIETTAKFYAHAQLDDVRAALDAEAPRPEAVPARRAGDSTI